MSARTHSARTCREPVHGAVFVTPKVHDQTAKLRRGRVSQSSFVPTPRWRVPFIKRSFAERAEHRPIRPKLFPSMFTGRSFSVVATAAPEHVTELRTRLALVGRVLVGADKQHTQRPNDAVAEICINELEENFG